MINNLHYSGSSKIPEVLLDSRRIGRLGKDAHARGQSERQEDRLQFRTAYAIDAKKRPRLLFWTVQNIPW